MTLPVKEMRNISNRNSPAITLVERVYVGDGGGPATGTRVPFSSKTKGSVQKKKYIMEFSIFPIWASFP